MSNPTAAPLKQVKLDNGEHKDFDPANETVRLPAMRGTVTIRAQY